MGNRRSIHIFALAALGKGLSGGDRIFIEFARRWSKKTPVNIYVWEEGYQMCERQKLNGDLLKIHTAKVGRLSGFGFLFTYIYRVLVGIYLGLTLKPNDNDIVYSASEFWMDALPACILKIRNHNLSWVASWYQTAPNPLKGFTEGDRKSLHRLSALHYWLVQQPIKPLVAKLADYVLVNNEDEKKRYPDLNTEKRVIVVIGAVDLSSIGRYQSRFKNPAEVYDAVFQGRFHPQKGVVELVQIWKEVAIVKPAAKLVMIGDGPLMKQVKKRVDELGLKGNITLAGYVFDGPRKYKIFSQSKVVVHPAFYDSGGMASAEAMAFGLPCVGFDLKSYSSYYPHGMIKVKIGAIKEFAETIVKLLDNASLRTRIGKEAKEMIEARWSWDQRANEVFSMIHGAA